MFVASLVCLVTFVWMLIKIWKDSPLLAIASFLFWPALFVALFKYWGDEESDIKVPFAIFALCTVYSLWALSRMVRELKDVQETMLWTTQYFA